MPDILIRGVRVPVACSDCPSRDVSVCVWTDNAVDRYQYEKPNFCPISELPPHGDLISAEDAKTVIDRFLGYLDEEMIYRIKYKLNQDCPVIVSSNKEEIEDTRKENTMDYKYECYFCGKQDDSQWWFGLLFDRFRICPNCMDNLAEIIKEKLNERSGSV